MVVMTNKQAAILALVPCAAEEFAHRANQAGNLYWHGSAKGIIEQRNVLYIGVALFAIGMVGLTLSGGWVFSAMALSGAGISAVASVLLYNTMREVQEGWSGWCNQYGNLFRG